MKLLPLIFASISLSFFSAEARGINECNTSLDTVTCSGGIFDEVLNLGEDKTNLYVRDAIVEKFIYGSNISGDVTAPSQNIFLENITTNNFNIGVYGDYIKGNNATGGNNFISLKDSALVGAIYGTVFEPNAPGRAHRN